jgi:peroxiredoxin
VVGGLVTLGIVAVILIFAWLRVRSVTPTPAHSTGPALTHPGNLHSASNLLAGGTPAPNFQLRGIDGKTYSLAAQRGHPVVLEFFAVWCPHCQHEAPLVQRIFSTYNRQGVRVWAILANPYGPNYDNSFGTDTSLATASDLRWFARTFHEAVPQLVDPNFHVVNRYGVSGYPSIYVIDKRGVIRYVGSGEQPYNTLASAVARAIAA